MPSENKQTREEIARARSPRRLGGALSIVLLGVLLVALAMQASGAPPGSGWQIHFADEFEGEALDLMKWDYNYPTNFFNSTNYHNHNAVVAESNVSVSNGSLTLHANYGTPDWAADTYRHGGRDFSIDYTSGAVNSSNDYLFQYGYLEARMKLPPTVGSWPAFWTHQRDEWPPEIDIMEHFMREDTAQRRQEFSYAYIWGPDYRDTSNQRHYPATGVDLTAGFHDYAIEWTPDALKFYFDGVLMRTMTGADRLAYLDSGNYILFNYAVGGRPMDGSDFVEDPSFSDDFEIDWVRVWKQETPETRHRWTNPASGLWEIDEHWDSAAPQVGTQTAVFGDVGSPSVLVFLPNLVTAGNLEFNGSTDYTLGQGTESLMLAPADRSATSTVGVTGSGQHTIKSRIDLWGNLTIENTGSGSGLVLEASVVGQGTITVSGNPGDPTQTGFGGGVTTQHFVVERGASVEALGLTAHADATIAAGGDLTATGIVHGNLHNQGAVSPGEASGVLMIGGDATFSTEAMLQITLADADSALLAVAGTLSASGSLKVGLEAGFTPQLGDSFQILQFGAAVGGFSSYELPALSAGLTWDARGLFTTGELEVIAATDGDFDADGDADLADLLMWQRGESFVPHSQADFDLWVANYAGGSITQSQLGPVPEPSTLLILTLTSVLCCWKGPRNKKSHSPVKRGL